MQISKAQFDELYAYAAMLANAERLTMTPTAEASTYSLGDVNAAGTDMLNILDAISGGAALAE